MKTYTLYHATDSSVEEVMDRPEIRSSLNGVGFYMTRDIELAKSWGRKIIAFVLPVEFEVDKVRPIDLSFLDGIRSYSDCAADGLEYVITKHTTMRKFTLLLEDCFVMQV